MSQLEIERVVGARIPTPESEFRLLYYNNNRDSKEHLALVSGDVSGKQEVLVRVHSECFTGEVLGSQRCDCRSQLSRSMQLISQEGQGVVIYLRQEGRGIGLLDKLRAYNLQDMGYDTVDANLMLGHQVDERDYKLAALILQDLDIQSVRLITNNPSKINALESLGIKVASREPTSPQVNKENSKYLASKASRMGHLMDMAAAQAVNPSHPNGAELFSDKALKHSEKMGQPFLTLTYAQSLDGCIAQTPGEPIRLSGPKSTEMTHRLRAFHDAIIVGIGTVIADNPSLNVRLADGPDPQPIVLDSKLRFPVDSNLLQKSSLAPWIVTTELAPGSRQRELENLGARVIRLPHTSNYWVNLPYLLQMLVSEGVRSVMVEGGARIITSFLSQHLVDHVVLTIVPVMLGGMRAVGDLENGNGQFPRLTNVEYQKFGDDLVIWGDTVRSQD